MKKLFTLAAAVLASVSMFAADYEPTAVYKVGDETTLGAQWKDAKQKANYFEVADTIVMSPFVLYQSAAKDWQEWTGSVGAGSSGTSWNAISGRCFLGSAAMFNSDAKIATVRSSRIYKYNVTNCTQVMALVKTSSSITMTMSAYEIVESTVATEASKTATYKSGSNGIISIEELDAAKTYRIEILTDNSGSNSSFYEIAFVQKPSKEPALAFNPSEIDLDVTASNPNPSAKVVLKGKNLTPGQYSFNNSGNVAGLTINPTTVTVAEDGTVNAEITFSYANESDAAPFATIKTIDIAHATGDKTAQISINLSATHAKTYITKNVNIEQAVLDYGTKYDIKAALTAAGWEYENLNDLDTLNDIENKTNRNYDFLGLKIKTSGAYVAGWLQADGLLLVKFGNIGGDIKVSVKGATTDATQTFAKADLWNEDDQAYVLPIYGFTEDVYVKIETTSGSTVVLKQLMLDELAKVTLPAPGAYLVTCAEAENGKVEATWPNKKYRTPVGATVTLTVTPAENYKVVDVKVNGISLNAVENVYSFTMPAEDVTVTATFELDSTVGIEDTEASVKAVKFFQNGQLFIEKNGKVYTITGSKIR